MLAHRILGLLAAVTLFTGTAQAATYSMTGEWWLNRGNFIDIPVNGGPVICVGGAVNDGCIDSGLPVDFKPANGGVPGSAPISVTGAFPQPFTVPTNAFSQTHTGPPSVFAITLNPVVVQLSSSITAKGPYSITPSSGPAVASFQEDAWSNDPRQAARLAKAFDWCPGAYPACGAASNGTPYPLRVVYAGGNNGFGGTMSIVLSGHGAIVVRATNTVNSATNPSLGPVQVRTFGGGSGMGSQAPGRGFATTETDALAQAGQYSTAMIGVLCTGPPGGGPMPSNCGLITALGNLTSSGSSGTNLNYGFPWTTGMVSAINTGSIGTVPQSTTLVATGSDSRRANGSGNITMVSAGVSARLAVPGNNFSNLDVVQMRFVAPVPALSPTGMAIGVAMLALSAGYALRKRF